MQHGCTVAEQATLCLPINSITLSGSDNILLWLLSRGDQRALDKRGGHDYLRVRHPDDCGYIDCSKHKVSLQRFQSVCDRELVVMSLSCR